MLERLVLGGGVISVLISLLLTVGWFINVYHFATADFEAPYKEEIIRGVGIPFSPIGGIVGYINVGK